MLTAANAEVVTPAGAKWAAALRRVSHDIYHTPEYHTLSGFGQAGAPMAFLYEEGDSCFLWPYLLNPIAWAPGYNDATSVYGYPGPVSSGDEAFAQRAWRALIDSWKTQNVVSAFTRFHPLLANSNLLDLIPEFKAGVREFGNTVSVDLTLAAEDHSRRYNKNLRYDIRKAREAGLATAVDPEWHHTDDFVAVYQDTMARLGSRPEYIVDRPWVERLRQALGSNVRLFVTKRGGNVAAAMIAIGYGNYLHSHLIGSAPEYVALSPSKLLLDDVRIWGMENGYRSMHLGGGLGGREDGLFQFKRKFSPIMHPFRTGNWVLNLSMYRNLEEQNRLRLAALGIQMEGVKYFPAYRFNSITPDDFSGERR